MSKSQYGKTTPCGWLVAKSYITARMVETQRKSWDAYHLYSTVFNWCRIDAISGDARPESFKADALMLLQEL
jgi:hypothetical protein